MPVPFLIAGAAAIAGTTGVVKGAKAIHNNAEAKELLDLIDKNCTSTYLTTVSYDDIDNLKNSLN